MQVILTNGEGITGAVIRWYTWSNYAHAGILLNNGKVIDAVPSKGISLHDGISGSKQWYFDIEYLPDVDQAKIESAVEKFLRAQIGKKYDWSAIYGMGFRRDWHNPHEWFCSELVEAAFDYAGLPLLRAGHLDRVTPRDIGISPRLRLNQVVG